MSEMIVPAFGCFALGLMTTIHPCPLTANIAAISMLSGVSSRRKKQLAVIALFVAGYLFAFIGLAVVVNTGIMAVPKLSLFLQSIISAFFGPLFILVGMVVAGLIDLNRFYTVVSMNKNYWLTQGSVLSSFLLGALLAMTFCPATASVFFGVMLPLSIKHGQPYLFPVLFAAGALLPVVSLSAMVYHSTIHKFKNNFTRKVPVYAGWVMVIIGIYISIERLYLN